MPKLDWEMRVAVISTAHMPGPDPDFGGEYVWKPVDDPGHTTVMVLVEDLDEGAPKWLIKLKKAAERQGLDLAWVRFDQDASVIDGLPTFDWN